MRTSTLLLGGSLVVNLAFIAGLAWRGWSAEAEAAGAPAITPAKSVAPAVTDAIGRDFATVPPEQLRDRLRALDLPPLLVEQIVVARIRSRLVARERELIAVAMRAAPPWKQAAMKNDRLSILTPAQRKELRDLEAEARDETLRLLGPGPLDRGGIIAFKYGFVPPAKAVLLDALERDYLNLQQRLQDDMRNLTLPEDRTRAKFLEAEKQRDLAALLTPAELDGYEMRASLTALSIPFQNHIAAFQATEEEYRALFAVQKAFDAKKAEPGYSPPPRVSPPGATMGMMSGPTEPEAEEVRAVLSPERFADWQLSGESHYQSLARLATTNSIADVTVKQVATLLTQTTEKSWTIADDATMTPAQKKAALADLATATRAQVNGQLGAAVGDPYLKSLRWFDSIATGTAIKLSPNMVSYRDVDPPARQVPPRP